MTRILLVLLFTLFTGCAYENRSSIEVTGRAAPSSATSCTFAAGGQNILGPGILDVSFTRRSYSTVVYVSNNLTDPKAVNPDSTTDAKAWRAESVKVRLNPKDYTDAFGASPALLAVTGENILPLDNLVTPPNGKSAQFADLVSPALGDAIASGVSASTGRVVLGVTLQGHTLDGAKLDSGEWFFPLDVCDGCLQPAVACLPGQTFAAGNCFGVGQDNAPVCVCPGGLTACATGCVNLQADNSNCGACGTACATGQTCNGGKCI